MSKLEQAESRFLRAQEDRRQAILASVRADIPLRQIAGAAHCSHETIRRLVAADGEATLEFGGRNYVLPGQTVELLIYKLGGNARGAFSRDLELIDAGTGWLRHAGLLADELHATTETSAGAPVKLDSPQAFALHQVLRLTEMNRPSILHSLAESLRETYGYPPYQPRSLKRWGVEQQT